MSTIIATPGGTAPLFLLLTDGSAGLFPRAEVFNSVGTSLALVPLADVGGGLYYAPWTLPGTAGKFQVVYTIYQDAGHTIDLSSIRARAEDFIQSDLPTNASAIAATVWNELMAGHGVSGSFGLALRTILGIAAFNNFRLDNTVYDVNGFMTSGRMRVFANAAAANASTPGGTGEGEIATLTLGGTPDSTHLVVPTTMVGTGAP